MLAGSISAAHRATGGRGYIFDETGQWDICHIARASAARIDFFFLTDYLIVSLLAGIILRS